MKIRSWKQVQNFNVKHVRAKEKCHHWRNNDNRTSMNELHDFIRNEMRRMQLRYLKKLMDSNYKAIMQAVRNITLRVNLFEYLVN